MSDAAPDGAGLRATFYARAGRLRAPWRLLLYLAALYGGVLVVLAERLGAPVMTAPFASRLAFPEEHPLFAGFLPAAPQAVSDRLMAHDLVLVVGAPVFTFHIEGDAPLFRSGIPIFQLTMDGEAAASAPAGTAILGSLRLGLPALLQRLDDLVFVLREDAPETVGALDRFGHLR